MAKIIEVEPGDYLRINGALWVVRYEVGSCVIDAYIDPVYESEVVDEG